MMQLLSLIKDINHKLYLYYLSSFTSQLHTDISLQCSQFISVSMCLSEVGCWVKRVVIITV